MARPLQPFGDMQSRTVDSGAWVAIVGSRSEGRLDVVRALAGALRGAGRAVGGVLQEPRREAGVLVGYDLHRIGRRGWHPLAREVEDPEICRWGFSDAAFRAARGWVLDPALDVRFVEAGRIEAAGRGHWPTLVDALAADGLTVVSLRRGVLASVALRLPDPIDGLELPAPAAEVDRFIQRVARRCAPTEGSHETALR